MPRLSATSHAYAASGVSCSAARFNLSEHVLALHGGDVLATGGGVHWDSKTAFVQFLTGGGSVGPPEQVAIKREVLGARAPNAERLRCGERAGCARLSRLLHDDLRM